MVVELLWLHGRWVAFIETGDEFKVLDPFPRGADLREVLKMVADPQYAPDIALARANLSRLLEVLLVPLRPWLRGKRVVFFAPDHQAWTVPYADLAMVRWNLLPWWKRPLGGMGQVATVVSASHLWRCIEKEDGWPAVPSTTGFALGSAGDAVERLPVESLVHSLRQAPPAPRPKTWEVVAGDDATLEMLTRLAEYDIAVLSWHTEGTGKEHSVAQFHLARGERPSLGHLLSVCRLKSRVGLVLSCQTTRVLESGVSDISSVAFGLMEAMGASSFVAATHKVDALVVFLLGRYLLQEFGRGRPLYAALHRARKRLRRARARDIVSLLGGLEKQVPSLTPFREKMEEKKANQRPFREVHWTAPFCIMGWPDRRLEAPGKPARV
ncbi:MAG: CHAT domain-containing protein [Chloroflexi bacterium]|nr:CHAT domain-containing protein [Chloroflexota bacterium]